MRPVVTAWWMWVRSDAARRWRPALVLLVLVALAGGAVLAATAGGRRNGTAVERLTERTSPGDALVLPNVPGFDWDRVRAMPDVRAVAEFPVSSYRIRELRRFGEIGGFPAGSPEAGTTVEAPVTVAGRNSNPDAVDEVVASTRAASLADLQVGDHLTIDMASPEEAERAWAAGGEPDWTSGPTQRVRIVGIVKGSFFGDSINPTYAFFRHYRANLLPTVGYVNAVVQLRSGPAGVDAFGRDLARVVGHPVEQRSLAADLKGFTNATHLERDALYGFALAAGLALVVLVGQAVARMVSASAGEVPLLSTLGFTRGQTAAALAALPATALVLGAGLAPAVAWLASGRFPIGIGRQAEPDPGRHLDRPVLGVGTALLVLVALAGSYGLARLALRRRTLAAEPAASRVAAAVGAAGAPVPMVLGARLALERGGGRSTVPVRPALVGAVVGVAGIVGALTFGAGLDRAATDPDLFGQSFDAMGSLSADGALPATLDALAARADVETVTEVRNAVLSVEGRDVSAFGLDSLSGEYDAAVVDGRAPDADDEIGLAPVDMRALGVGPGDKVTLDDFGVTLTVVGETFVPELGHTPYDIGALLTADGMRRFVPDDRDLKFGALLLGYAPGADAAGTSAAISDEVPGLWVEPREPSQDQENLGGVRNVPPALGAFLALLAVGAVGHALASTVRRRRHDLAVLRALGLTRRQARATVAWQATTLALVGLALGVPLGVAAGRLLWQAVAEQTPVVYVPPLAVLALVVVPPVAVATCNAIAAWPGHLAARLRPAESLRTE